MATVLSFLMLGTATFWAMHLGRSVWNPSSCGSCHAMKAETTNWAIGPHSKVACVQCHGRVPLTRFAFAAWTGRYKHPVMSQGSATSAACLTCHNSERQITPTKDLTISHNFHISINMDCVDCHADLVHGTPGANAGLEPSSFSKRVPMERCRTCHNGQMAPKECTTCHADAEGNKPTGPKQNPVLTPAAAPSAPR